MFSFRHRWIADILVLSLLVYFGVNAFMTVLNSRLAPTPAMQEQAVKLSEKAAADARPLEDYAIITERNLFGGTSQGLAEASPEEIVLDDMPVAVKSL